MFVREYVCEGARVTGREAYRFGSDFAFALISFKHFHYASACGTAGRRRVATRGVWLAAKTTTTTAIVVCLCGYFSKKTHLFVFFHTTLRCAAACLCL